MTILVTGTSRGIGKGLADHYRASGAQVIGTVRRHPGPGEIQMDVTDPSSVRGMVEALNGQPIDLLVCNAGIYPDKGQELETGFAPELWDQVFRTNVTGTFLTVQALLPNLRAADRPRIALISSRIGSCTMANGGSYIYRSSKAAVTNLGVNLALDLREEGIAVGIFHPGWVRTDMGGSDADIDISASVAGLVEQFDQISIETSGAFRNFNGAPLPF